MGKWTRKKGAGRPKGRAKKATKAQIKATKEACHARSAEKRREQRKADPLANALALVKARKATKEAEAALERKALDFDDIREREEVERYVPLDETRKSFDPAKIPATSMASFSPEGQMGRAHSCHGGLERSKSTTAQVLIAAAAAGKFDGVLKPLTSRPGPGRLSAVPAAAPDAAAADAFSGADDGARTAAEKYAAADEEAPAAAEKDADARSGGPKKKKTKKTKAPAQSSTGAGVLRVAALFKMYIICAVTLWGLAFHMAAHDLSGAFSAEWSFARAMFVGSPGATVLGARSRKMFGVLETWEQARARHAKAVHESGGRGGSSDIRRARRKEVEAAKAALAVLEEEPFFLIARNYVENEFTGYGAVPLLEFDGTVDALSQRTLQLAPFAKALCEELHVDQTTVTEEFLYLVWLMAQGVLLDDDLYQSAVAMDLVLGHCVLSRYVIERFAHVRKKCCGLRTTLDDYAKACALFGNGAKKERLCHTADKKFWKELCDNFRDDYAEPPKQLSRKVKKETWLLAIHNVHEKDGWRIEKLDTASSKKLEASLFWYCFAMVDTHLGTKSVPRGEYYPDFTRKCKLATAAMGILRDICPVRDDPALTNLLSVQYNAAYLNVALCKIVNGEITVIVSRTGSDKRLQARRPPTKRAWYAANEKDAFVGKPVPKQAGLGHTAKKQK